MGYSRQDWLRDQDVLPGINLDAIRFGNRVERRKPLNVPYHGQRDAGSESSARDRRKKNERDDEPGLEQFQLRLW